MLENTLDALREAYSAARPARNINDPIRVGHFLQEVRLLRVELERIGRQLENDEADFHSRFQDLVEDRAVQAPSRFNPVEPQDTIIETMREFVRRNQGQEFTAAELRQACGLRNASHVGTVRSFLARLVEEGTVARVQRGVFATPSAR